MDVVAFRNAFRSAVRACLNASATDAQTEAIVQWEDDGAACVWRPMPYVDLLELSEDTVGVDETRFELDTPNDDPIEAHQNGLRQITVQVKAISDASCTDESAATLISNVRLRLRRPSILAILQAANIAVARFNATTRATFDQDNRTMDVRVMDIVLLTSDTDVADPEAGDYFDTVDIQEELEYP